MSEPLPKIDRYELLEVLGTGAEGIVYLARDPVIGRQVALKTSPLGVVNEEQRDRRMREIRAVGRLAHPNIVTIFDAGVDGNRAYIVFELIEGRSLQDVLLEQGRLPWAKAVEFVADLAGALGHAHERDVVHRDLKPANMLIDGDEKVLLTDFGIARAGDALVSEPGDLRGTPAYMAPEYLTSQSEPNASTDLFALGVVFYQLLTGVLPFAGTTLPEVVHAIVREPFIDPALVVDGVPEEVLAVCRKCLNKDASERYTSGAELREALLCALERRVPSGVPDADEIVPPEVVVSRHGVASRFIVSLVFVFSLVVAWSSVMVRPAFDKPTQLVVETVEYETPEYETAEYGATENETSSHTPFTVEPVADDSVLATHDDLWFEPIDLSQELAELEPTPEMRLETLEAGSEQTGLVSLPIGFLSNVPRGQLRIRSAGQIVLERDFSFERKSLRFWRSDGRVDFTAQIPQGNHWLQVEIERPGRSSAAAGIDVEVDESGKLWVSFKSSSGVAVWYDSPPTIRASF